MRSRKQRVLAVTVCAYGLVVGKSMAEPGSPSTGQVDVLVNSQIFEVQLPTSCPIILGLWKTKDDVVAFVPGDANDSFISGATGAIEIVAQSNFVRSYPILIRDNCLFRGQIYYNVDPEALSPEDLATELELKEPCRVSGVMWKTSDPEAEGYNIKMAGCDFVAEGTVRRSQAGGAYDRVSYRCFGPQFATVDSVPEPLVPPPATCKGTATRVR